MAFTKAGRQGHFMTNQVSDLLRKARFAGFLYLMIAVLGF